jgi:hypothetical protein
MARSHADARANAFLKQRKNRRSVLPLYLVDRPGTRAFLSNLGSYPKYYHHVLDLNATKQRERPESMAAAPYRSAYPRHG